MSYSPTLGSVFNRTKMRDPSHVCSFSGMCAMCTADCIGSCEIGLSAVRGMETVYPTTTGENQIASEKAYPVDYSHFNINGRSFGAMGAPLDADRATIYHVGLEREIGTLNPVKLALPIILPALIKLNWPDYFGGAAMAGVNSVIGEGAVSKDPTLAYENGKVVHAPKLREMLDAFNKYDRGYGQIILQANYDDDAQGVPEYAIRECGAKAIEFKFGQSAKGTQPANLVPTLEEALKGADVFLGLSVADVLPPDMVRSMAANPIVFALANPNPEISYENAMESRGDIIFATGRSDYPNQVNNVLGFPYIFRGALDVRARKINEEMKVAAVHALAELAKQPVPDMVLTAYNKEHIDFGREYLIPKALDPRLITEVTCAVAQAAIDSGVARQPIANWHAYRAALVCRTKVVHRLATMAAAGGMECEIPNGR